MSRKYKNYIYRDEWGMYRATKKDIDRYWRGREKKIKGREKAEREREKME